MFCKHDVCGLSLYISDGKVQFTSQPSAQSRSQCRVCGTRTINVVWMQRMDQTFSVASTTPRNDFKLYIVVEYCICYSGSFFLFFPCIYWTCGRLPNFHAPTQSFVTHRHTVGGQSFASVPVFPGGASECPCHTPSPSKLYMRLQPHRVLLMPSKLVWVSLRIDYNGLCRKNCAVITRSWRSQGEIMYFSPPLHFLDRFLDKNSDRSLFFCVILNLCILLNDL
jgi:hypothetical protein